MGRNTNGGKVIYDIAFSDGKTYSTFDANLAQQAQTLQGQQGVTLRYEITQNGQYQNTNVVALFPAGVQAPPAQQQVPIAGASPVPVQGGGGGGGMTPEDKARLTRLSAASTAFEFVGALLDGAGPEAAQQGLGLARQLTEEINAYGMSGQWSGGIQATPLGVAATVAGVQVGTGGITPPQVEQPQQQPGNDIPWGAAAQ
jgi:hypothetical protein